MKKFLIISIACAVTMLACACGPKTVTPDDPQPDPPTFSLNSYNGHVLEAIAGAYKTFEETRFLPNTVNVEGIKMTKGQYIMAACELIDKINADPKGWQEVDIDPITPAVGDEYRWNTYDLDTIDWAHIKYMSGRLLSYANEKKALPNYVTFPSGDPSSPGYLPQLTMVVTKHDNLMNLRACMVVLARTLCYFKDNEGKWPEEVSAWPSDYMGPSRNCPTDDPVVKATLADALKGLSESATPRQKAEAIFAYTRDEWEWEDYYNTRKGAVGTINAKGGNCCDLTHATLALCHAAGIPARYLHGQCYFSSGVIGHVIPEIYVDGKWWVCDPSNNNATFGTPTWKGMETFNGRYYELEF